jgi:hypothetical protein
VLAFLGGGASRSDPDEHRGVVLMAAKKKAKKATKKKATKKKAAKKKTAKKK